jgi:hypothetical protein
MSISKKRIAIWTVFFAVLATAAIIAAIFG